MATERTEVPTTDAHAGRGLTLPCPHCGDAGACITVCMADGETFYCTEHDGTFSAQDVREFIAKWSAVLAWLDAIPSDA
jgi:hypothetical protein